MNITNGRPGVLARGMAGIAVVALVGGAVSSGALAQQVSKPKPPARERSAPDERPPLPSSDFSVRGTVTPKGEATFAYRDGHLRVEIFHGAERIMVGLVDPEAHTIIVLPDLPGMGSVAFEMDLPPEFRFVSMPADSRRIGFDTVSTEPCEVWRGTDPDLGTPVQACFTVDGIPLRVQATTRQGLKVAFEATELERGPQDPAAFDVPEGVRVQRVPPSLQDMVPGGGLSP
ncbi:hypothetical protein NVS89_07535 [Ancylobacter sp. MQZ15Z-1]|uniref:DUF4412 domain-containing protein n=1 Tax=Ancylobacter mangrovi TaxID=2972472 RepID=A0A9X2T1E8_9HYPH|nr:hypothetical protein [Ancylobacter mangrovi]MCS0494945.1 hypothetical protein [Ancylobacter mangrovi]